MTPYELSILAMIFLQIADAGTTYKAISEATATEGNPLLLRIMQRLGLRNALILKLIFGGAIAWYCWTHPDIPYIPVVVTAVNVAYAYVVWCNFKIIRGR